MNEDEILLNNLSYYLYAPLEYVLQGIKIKERILTSGNLQLIVYSNDHNPPHFHVITKDGKIDARFTIEDCTPLKGNVISPTDEKRVRAFHADIKVKLMMESIWAKRELK